MAPPTKLLGNVLVGLAHFYIAPVGTADPADSLAFNTAWLAPWYHPGYLDSGVTLGLDKKEKKHRVDDISTPAVITVEESTVSIMVTMAEATLENLRYASGGGTVTVTAPGTGQIGKKTLVLSEDLEVLRVGFEGKNPQGFFRRVIIPRVVSVGKIKAEWDRSKNKQMYAATFESICSVEEILIYDKTANATA